MLQDVPVYSMANRDGDGNATGMKFKISGDLNLKKYQIEPKYDVTEKD
jgi:hypothetical protein